MTLEAGLCSYFGRRTAGMVLYLCKADIALRLRSTAVFDTFGRQTGCIRICSS